MTTSNVHQLAPAEAPDKAGMLEMLDEIRAGVEAGKTLSLVAIPINAGREFVIRYRGELRMLELVGLLERAKFDALVMTNK
jgi:hypothetical protein